MYGFIFLIFISLSVFAQGPAPVSKSPPAFQNLQSIPHQFIGKKTGIPIAQARPEDITPENYPYKIKELNFPNASLQEVIKTMSVNMNINLIMDPTLGHTQKISIISYLPLTVAEYYQAFLSVLALHNLAVIRSGPFLKVVSSDVALKSNLRVHTGDEKINTDQFLTRVIKLKHINADSLQTKIKPFIDEKSVKSLIFYPPSNAVIISDYGSNLNKITNIIKSLDIPSQDSIFEVLPIKHAQAKKLVEIISKLLPSQKRGYTSRYRTSKSKTPSSAQTINISSLSHDDRTNSIIVMGNKAGVNQVKDLVRRLDYYTNPDLAGGIYVYKVKHGTATDLAKTLNELMGKASNVSGGGKGKGKGTAPHLVKRGGAYGTPASSLQNTSTALAFEDINIIAEKNTNSLLIVANRNNYQNILNILKKVDISRNQVFVKSIIMEMNTSKNNDWQMANYFFPKEGGGLARMGYGLSNFTDITSLSGSSATLFFPLSLFLGKSSNSYTNLKDLLNIDSSLRGKPLGSTLPKVEVPTLSSFVKFLQTNVGANILSTPQVMALDHQKAEVSIVDKIPKVSSRTKSTNAFSSDQVSAGEDEVTTSLIITPHINPDVNSIRLEIEQRIDDILPAENVPEELQKSNKAIKKRTIKTFITLQDKETAVLGGLVREQSSNTENKVPILGDLPLIGWLFKNSERRRRKTNLVVFITPHIIRSAKEHSSILSAKLKERMNFIRKFTGNEDPYKEITDQMQNINPEETLPELMEESAPIDSAFSDPEESLPESDMEPDPTDSAFSDPEETLPEPASEPELTDSAFSDPEEILPEPASEPDPTDSAFSDPEEILPEPASEPDPTDSAFSDPEEILPEPASEPDPTDSAFSDPEEILPEPASEPDPTDSAFSEPEENLSKPAEKPDLTDSAFSDPKEVFPKPAEKHKDQENYYEFEGSTIPTSDPTT